MPLAASENQVFDGQTNFSGGMNMVGPVRENQYHYCENMMLEGEKLVTRPGFVRAYQPQSSGVSLGFYFNEEDARLNDATHTGFWFPFRFVVDLFGQEIQGSQFIRLPGVSQWLAIFASQGRVYTNNIGISEEVAVDASLSTTQTVKFMQANHLIFLFRGLNYKPLWWDGSDAGFVEVPDYEHLTETGLQSIPWVEDATYFQGRLWAWRNRDDIYLSDILDFTAWDFVQGRLSVNKGDGGEIVSFIPFHDDFLLVGKTNGIYAIRDFVGDRNASSYRVFSVVNTYGLVAPKGWVVSGERILYLSPRGIDEMSRNSENNLEGFSQSLSHEIQPIIDRINWDQAHKSVAFTIGNIAVFAVPIDGSLEVNAAILWDATADGGKGAFISLWKADPEHVFSPDVFNVVDNEVFFTNTSDGVIRTIDFGSSKDSKHPEKDVPIYTEKEWDKGSLVLGSEPGAEGIYECIRRSAVYDMTEEELVYKAPGDTDYWTLAPDVYDLFHIQARFIFREIDHREPGSAKVYQTGEVMVSHSNPLIDVFIREPGPYTRKQIVTDKTWDRVVYDAGDQDDWVDTNINLDLDTPHRRDYMFRITSAENFKFKEAQIVKPSAWRIHRIPFIPFLVRNRSFFLELINKRGIIKIEHMIIPASVTALSGRET